MIYFLSDQHGGERVGDLPKYLEEATDEDVLIILGDVGLKFRDTEENRAFDELLLSSKKKIILLEGNHENFDYLETFPLGERYGAPVRILTENIVLLQRGYIYEICGKTFFAFGSCRSGSKWKDMGLWWPQEAPTEEQLARAYETLKARGNKVDYILTHKYEEGKGTRTSELYNLCNYINENVDFKMWFAGHWHEHRWADDKHIFLYDKLTSIDSIVK